MGTQYPPGMDGTTVMRNTAAALQATLRDLLMSDLTAEALDDDMLQIRIPGMHARALLRIMADRGIIEYPRISTTPETSDDSAKDTA